MARTRQIKPDFFTDEDLAALSPYARLLFVGLWTLADRRGRLEERLAKIKACIFPYEDVSIDHLIEELASPKQRGGSLIVRYEKDGRKYIQVCNFEKHQNCHPKEPDSTIPGPLSAAIGRGKTRQAAEGRVMTRQAAEKRGETVARNAVPSVPSVTSVPSGPSFPSGPNERAAPARPPIDGFEPRVEATPEEATRRALEVIGPPPRRPESDEAAALRREIVELLASEAEATGRGQDVLLAKASKAPGGQVIVNLASCGSVAWLRTTRDRLLEMRLSRSSNEPARPQPTPEPKVSAEAIEASREGAKAWNQIMAQVLARVPQHDYATWFRPTVCLGLWGDRLIVQGPNQKFVPALESRAALVADAVAAAGLSLRVEFRSAR